MHIKKMLVPLILTAMLAPMSSHAASRIVVGTDAPNDFAYEVTGDAPTGPVGATLGADLLEAALIPGVDSITFQIKVNGLPPTGGVPEAIRYVWDFYAGETLYELDGKFTNFSRGTCDPTAKTCPPPRNPGMVPFLLRGNCTATGNVSTCEELALLHGTIDQVASTISVAVPISKLASCDILGALSTSFTGATVIAIPSAFFSQNAMPSDKMVTRDEPAAAC